jgi:hypothetical protein
MTLRFNRRVFAALVGCGIALATPGSSRADIIINVSDNFGHTFSTGDLVATTATVTTAQLQAAGFFVATGSTITTTATQSASFTTLATSGTFLGQNNLSRITVTASSNNLTLPGGTTRLLDSADSFTFNGVFPGSGTTTDGADPGNALLVQSIKLGTSTYASSSIFPNSSPSSNTGTAQFSGAGSYSLTSVTGIDVTLLPGTSQFQDTNRVDAFTNVIPAPPAVFLVGAAMPVLAVRRYLAKRKAAVAAA